MAQCSAHGDPGEIAPAAGNLMFPSVSTVGQFCLSAMGRQHHHFFANKSYGAKFGSIGSRHNFTKGVGQFLPDNIGSESGLL